MTIPFQPLPITNGALRQLVEAALEEDLGRGDITSDLLVPPQITARAVFRSRTPGVLAGLAVAAAVYHAVDPALQFTAGKTLASYLRETGGLQSTADKGRIFIVLPDGTASPVDQGGWSRTSANVIPPGSTIIIPKDIDPLYKLDLIRDISTVVASLLTSVATVAILATR